MDFLSHDGVPPNVLIHLTNDGIFPWKSIQRATGSMDFPPEIMVDVGGIIHRCRSSVMSLCFLPRYGGFLSHGGIPSSHPFIRHHLSIFEYIWVLKPASLGDHPFEEPPHCWLYSPYIPVCLNSMSPVFLGNTPDVVPLIVRYVVSSGWLGTPYIPTVAHRSRYIAMVTYKIYISPNIMQGSVKP